MISYFLYLLTKLDIQFINNLIYKPFSKDEFEKYHLITSTFCDFPELGEKLFDYNEYFISPCVLNEVNCGTLPRNKWVPKIKFLGFVSWIR